MSLRSAWRLLPVLGLGACAVFQLSSQKKAWPDHAASVDVKGPTRSVSIARDELGVPHIRAESRADAIFALGFAHAQDRLFQADLTRRLIYGEASTLLGDRTVELDAFARGMQVREKAQAEAERSTFEVKAMLEAYSLGFNAGRDSLKKLPIEYRLLGVEEVPDWTPADCVANAYLQSWGLSENSQMELAALAFRDLDAESIDRLIRYDPESPPLTVDWDTLRTAEIGAYTKGWKAWSGALGGGVREPTSEASNNWIVGPDRSANGKPIVANDPHLGQRVPSIWYAADMRGGDLHLAGVTFAGTPAVVIGHNHHIAWGLTNVMADYIDFAILEADGDNVVVAGETVPVEWREVTVEVKGAEPVTRTIPWTPIGPVITEAGKANVVVMRWHAMEVEGETTTAFFGLNTAQTVSEALEATDRPMIVAQNLVVADLSGDFAWQQIGSVPVRKNHTGRVPYPGSDPEHGWDGWYTELPGERAPERGFLVTANSRPTVDRPATRLDEEGQPIEADEEVEPIDVHGISTGWTQGWRYQRIYEQLAAKPNTTPEQIAALQLDVRDKSAETLLPELLEGVEGSTTAAKRCKRILAAWDFEADVDSVGATVWITFQRELLREALADELGDGGFETYLSAFTSGRNALGVGIDPWVDDRADAVDTALSATCTRLESTLGEYEGDWMWGKVHVLRLTHPFADGRGLLSKWNAPPRDFPGNSATVAAASANWRDGEKRVGGMASMRIVMPLADLTKTTLVHPGGQSGFPRHPNAFSHFDAFVAGQTLPLYSKDADVAAHTVSIQTLVVPSSAPAPAPAAEPEPEAEAEPTEGEETPTEEAPAEEAPAEEEAEAPAEEEAPTETAAPE